MYFAFNLGALFLAAGLAQNGLTQTPPSPVPDVSAIFEGLIPPVKVLGNAIASFASGGNPGTLTQTLGLYTNGQVLIAAIDGAASSIQGLPQVSSATGKAIYDDISAIQPIIMQGFNDLTSKKDAFNGLLPAYLPALAKPQLLIAANLIALQSSFAKLKAGTLAITSPDILPEVQGLIGTIETALGAAITAYSS